jgi:2-isopropylmalate synthase
VQRIADESGNELQSGDIWQAFTHEYLPGNGRYRFASHRARPDAHASEVQHVTASIEENGATRTIEGRGRGPIDGFVDALRKDRSLDIRLVDYSEHAVGAGAQAEAAAYVELQIGTAKPVFGVGIDANIVNASLQAVISALNRAVR